MTNSNCKYPIKVITKDQKKYIFDLIRKKHIKLTPEEWVRQNFIKYLVEMKNYPIGLIGIEQKLAGTNQKFRTDIVVFSKFAKAVMIIECKSEKIKITQDAFDQAAKYNIQFKADYLVVTNGINHFICKMNYQEKSYNFVKEIPDYKELYINESK
ncbi:MAG: restriction endonuclease subunit R [Bacteroidetes bacterium]|nr:MAG: restriction endonuclease subunit R [Bacteroidota bacterium]